MADVGDSSWRTGSPPPFVEYLRVAADRCYLSQRSCEISFHEQAAFVRSAA